MSAALFRACFPIIALAVGGFAPLAESPALGLDDWAERPSGYQFSTTAPEALSDPHGAAILECKLRRDRGLGDCTLVSERPTGAGYGAWALRLAPFYRVKSGENEPATGATVRAAIVMEPEGADVPASEPVGPLAYPPRAAKFNRTGEAALSCVVGIGGWLRDCRIESETPAGFGFGEALLAGVPGFRMLPARPDEPLVAGARVTFPVSFGFH